MQISDPFYFSKFVFKSSGQVLRIKTKKEVLLLENNEKVKRRNKIMEWSVA
jgi:hypothetical protein